MANYKTVQNSKLKTKNYFVNHIPLLSKAVGSGPGRFFTIDYFGLLNQQTKSPDIESSLPDMPINSHP